MTLIRWLGCFGLLLLAGCVTSQDGPPGTPSAPLSGDVQTGQAVWRPRRSLPELAGELVVINPPGPDFLVRFSKDPLCLAQAESRANRWRIEFAAGTRRWKGRGQPPRWTAWSILPAALERAPVPKPWTADLTPSGEFRLSNSRTGESLEGFLTP